MPIRITHGFKYPNSRASSADGLSSTDWRQAQREGAVVPPSCKRARSVRGWWTGGPPVERQKEALARSTPVPEPGLMIGLAARAANDRAKVAAFARSFVRSLTDDRARGHS